MRFSPIATGGTPWSLGWTVVRFTWQDVVRRPEKLAAAVRDILTVLDPSAT